jgi:hypothetical protein
MKLLLWLLSDVQYYLPPKKSMGGLCSHNNLVEGSGNILKQKLISIVAGYSQAADANWLKPCMPGSLNHHCSCLKESQFNLFTNTK